MPQDETLQTAADLTEALHENTDALHEVRARFRFIFVFVVALALVVGLVVVTRHANRVEACRDENEIRQNVLDIADFLARQDDLSEVGQTIVFEIREDFALRSCGIPWI